MIQTTQFSLSPYHYSGAQPIINNNNIATSGFISGQANININNGGVDGGIKIGDESKKSFININGHQRNTNIDILARKRKWEQEKRGTLISADASRLYQTSNKINNEIDKRL